MSAKPETSGESYRHGSSKPQFHHQLHPQAMARHDTDAIRNEDEERTPRRSFRHRQGARDVDVDGRLDVGLFLGVYFNLPAAHALKPRASLESGFALYFRHGNCHCYDGRGDANGSTAQRLPLADSHRAGAARGQCHRFGTDSPPVRGLRDSLRRSTSQTPTSTGQGRGTCPR